MTDLQQTILATKAALADAVSAPLARLAETCAAVWPDADRLDRTLHAAIGSIPHCHLLYAWDVNGIEISSMVQPSGPESWTSVRTNSRLSASVPSDTIAYE